jgi:alpha/beta superfamily hydrolase
MYDFTFLAPCPSSGMIIQGAEDEIVPPASVEKLVEKLSAQRNLEIDYRLIPGANHFFHDNLEQLDHHLGDYLSKNVADPVQPVEVR